MSSEWVSTKIPRSLDKKLEEALPNTTYRSKTSFIAEAIREKLAKTPN